MKVLYDLKEMAMMELEPYVTKRNLSGSDWDRVGDVVEVLKDIVTTCAMEEGGYSQAGDWEAYMMGNYGRDGYDRGNSYAGRRRDSRGRYARDGGGSGGGRGGYSGDGESIERMLAEARTDRERDLIMRMAGRS